MRIAMFAASLVLAGCDSAPSDFIEPTLDPVEVFSVNVDTGATLAADAEPGKTNGVFVEYATGGAWHVFMTCDSDVSGYACGWDVIASVDPTETLTVTDQTELEADDKVLRVDKGAVRLYFQTDSDTDGVRLTAPPGSPLSLDLIWNGPVDPASTVQWVSGGTVHTGVPSNPVDFTPKTP